MMGTIYVIPASGMLVPDPSEVGGSDQVRLPAQGKEVEDSTYWQRRLRDGDVTIGRAPVVAVSKKGGEA